MREACYQNTFSRLKTRTDTLTFRGVIARTLRDNTTLSQLKNVRNRT
jgi:hypothetical protein